MQLYTPDNQLLLDVPVDDSSVRFKEIMGDNNLTLKFSLPDYIDFPIGTYCDFKAERYTLFSPDNFIKQHSEHYDYTLILEAWAAYMKFVKFKFFTVERNPGQPDKMVGAPKLKFSLTATPEDFVRLMADCMNFSGVTGWTVGECIESDPVTIDFNHDYCYGVLQKIANAFNTEWEVVDKTINMRKVERMDNNGNHISFPMSYGYDNGILPGITRKQFDDSKVINRVWIQGGERNINRGTYGNDTLLMPKSSAFEYEGLQYITDETGCYVEAAGRTGSLSEDSLDTSKVYPKRIGTVTAVIVVDDAGGLYDFTDTSIPDTLDFSKMVIPGETMTVIFQTGQLAGMEFEVKYIHSQRKFQIVPNTDNGLTYPQGTIIPAAGDKYGVFHMSLPQEYIDSAELESRDEAVKYLYENSQPKYTYQWQLDGIYANAQWGTIGGFLTPGYFVEFSDPQFLPDPVNIRITSVKEYVNKPKSPTIEISNNVTGKWLGDALNEIPTQEQGTDRKDKNTVNIVKRTWRSVMELVDNIYDPSGSFQEDILSAVALRTMILALGDPLLQYIFMDAAWQNQVEPAIVYDSGSKQLQCPASNIRHNTIGIDTVQPGRAETAYMHWTVTAYDSPVLSDDPGQFYYLYMRVSKTYTTDANGIMAGMGVYFISPVKVDFDSDPDNYILLVAFINSEDNGDRQVTYQFGFAELTPGMLRINNIASTDGNSYLKLLANQFKLGDGNNSMDYNVTEVNTLSLTNAVVRNALKVAGSAIIAGFKFYNDRIESVRTVSIGGTSYPAMTIIGNESQAIIELRSVVTKWTESNATTNVLQTIRIDSSTGEISSFTSDGDTCTFTSQGILANRAGTDALSATTGVSLKAAMVGLGFGKMDKSAWGNNWGVIGVYGDANNSSANPAPAYGGWFNVLKANGLCLASKLIQENETTVVLKNTDCFVSCYNTSSLQLYLPEKPYNGQFIRIKIVNQNVNIISDYNGNGLKINAGQYGIISSIGISDAITCDFVYDGNRWIFTRLD